MPEPIFSIIALNPQDPGWEAKFAELEARWGIANRAVNNNVIFVTTQTPVIENGTMILMGAWPAEPRVLTVLDAESSSAEGSSASSVSTQNEMENQTSLNSDAVDANEGRR